MSDAPNTDLVRQLERAFVQAARRYRAMSPADLSAAYEMLVGQTQAPADTALLDLAAQGSIDAAALLFVLTDRGDGEHDPAAIEALRAVVSRMPDVREALMFTALVQMFEEYAEGEVQAGRMRKTIDPVTGAALYSLVDPDA